MPLTLLHVEDNAVDADLIRRQLKRVAPDIRMDAVPSLTAARAALEGGQRYDLALIDLQLADGSGLELLAWIRERRLPLAVVILTGSGDAASAVAAIKAGADDYAVKSHGGYGQLANVLHDALRRHRNASQLHAHPLRVLYAEHSSADADLTRRYLARHAPHIKLNVVCDAQQVLARLPVGDCDAGDVDVILLDYRLPGLDALGLAKILRQERHMDIPIVLVTGQGNESVAVQALHLGVNDFITKHSGYLHELAPTLEKVVYQVELERQRGALEQTVAQRTRELEAARAAADEANAVKSIFLANMSHEIRAPMNAILGQVNLLGKEKLDGVQQERCAQITVAAQHLLAIVNDILDLSKIEAGKFQLTETDFSPGALFDRLRSLVAEEATAKGLDFRIDSTGLPARLHGDSTRLCQALLNYVGNAIKFTERGGILLRVRVLAEEADAVLARFEVEDTGIGIAPEHLPRLFQTFEQVVAPGSDGGGTGLGLAITRQLARLMGGDAGAESTPGHGSRFWFTARLRKSCATRAGGATPENPIEALRQRHAGKRVLVVDDEKINRELLSEILQEAGLIAEMAENGRVAVEMASTRDFALILTDMNMPVMGGIETARAIRALPGWASQPIVAMSASNLDEDRAACLAGGMNDYLVKPFEPDQLYALLLDRLG